MIALEDVFGINSKKIVLSYYERKGIDDVFSNYIRKQTKHIIIHGGSKQGKTTLVKKYLGDSVIKVSCDSTIKVKEDLYNRIFASINAKLESNVKLEETSGEKIGADISTGTIVDFAIKGKATIESSMLTKTESIQVPYSDIVDKLKRIYRDNQLKYIVIDDFHYLSMEIQKELSMDIRGLYDEGVFFIIIGVWSEQNKLLSYNPDLDGRFKEIDMSEWNKEDLLGIINNGLQILKLTLDDNIKKFIVDECLGNVGLLQTIMEELCENKGFVEESIEEKKIDVEKKEIQLIFVNIAKDNSFVNNLKEILRGSKKGTVTYILVIMYILSIIDSQDKKIFNMIDIVSELKKKYAGQSGISSNLHTSVPQICNGLQEKYSDIFSYFDQKLFVNNIYFLFRLKWNNSILLEQLRGGDFKKIDLT